MDEEEEKYWRKKLQYNKKVLKEKQKALKGTDFGVAIAGIQADIDFAEKRIEKAYQKLAEAEL